MICDPVDVFAFAATSDLPFEMALAAWLEGDTIAAATWTVPVGDTLVEVHDDAIIEAGLTAFVWVRGKNAGGGTAFVTVTVTTSSGLVGVFSWRFDVCDT